MDIYTLAYELLHPSAVSPPNLRCSVRVELLRAPPTYLRSIVYEEAMTTDLSDLCYSSDSSSSLCPSEIIEHCVDSDLSQVSEPASIHNLDAEVSRLLDYRSSDSESNEEPSHDIGPHNTASGHERAHESQTVRTHRLITGSAALSQSTPIKDGAKSNGHSGYNSESPNDSRPLSNATDRKMKETQTKHDYKLTSVRGGAILVSTSLQMEDRAPPVKTSHSDDKTLHPSGEMPGENLKNLALRRLQSDQSSRSSPTGSLQGTPSASSSQLYYDSDECTPRPLAEELEEVSVQEALESQALTESKQGLSLLIESGESSSSSELSGSEEETEGGSFESGEQQSSEEIDFELQEGGPSSHKLLREDKKESQHPLLSVLTTASRPKHDVHSSSDSSRCVHTHKKLDVKTTNIVGKAGLHLPAAHKHKENGEVMTTVQNRKKKSPPQRNGEAVAEGSRASQQALELNSATQGAEIHDIPSSSGSNSPPVHVKNNKVLQKEKEGSVSKIEMHADTQSHHQRPRFQHRNPSNDPQVRNPQHRQGLLLLKSPAVAETANTAEHDALLTEGHDKSRSLNDQPKRKATEEVDKPQQPETTSLEFHLEDLIHTDSEESVISSLSEAPSPSTDNLAQVPTPAQTTVECYNAENEFNNSLHHTGSEGSGSTTLAGRMSSLTLETGPEKSMPTRTSVHHPLHNALHSTSKATAATKMPLKGILKKKSTMKGANSTPSTGIEDKVVVSDTSSNNSVVDVTSDKTPTGSTTPDSLQPISSGQYISRPSTLPEHTTSSGSDDDRDLDRTLTADHRPNSSATTPSVVSHLQIKGAINSGQLNQTVHEATLVTSEDEVPLQNGVQDMRSEDQEHLHSSALQKHPNTSFTTSHNCQNHQRGSIAHNAQPKPPSPSLLLLDELTHTNSEATVLSSSALTPEDSTGCFQPIPTHRATENKTLLQGDYTLVSKVRALELRQTRIENAFSLEREALWSIIMKQNELIASLCKKRGQNQAKLTNMKRHLGLLEQKLENLEAGVVRIGRTAINQQRNGAPGTLTEGDLPGSEPWHRMSTLVSKKKLDKLTKFFGDTPPILQQFLKTLGYEEHIKKFEGAGIGLPELPHTTEEQLKQLGIPLGHRTRILQEAQKITQK